ncbi:MAG TPA: phosphotransferase family protein [bacterium]|nr:phosphotransferase family protein [bacterium]
MPELDSPEFGKYLAARLKAEDLEIRSVWQNLEGWSMETFSLDLSYLKDGRRVEHEVILRREPVAGLLDPYDVSIEYRVITAIKKAGVAVPETYWYEPDPAVFERPFYAMEKVKGGVHFWKMSFDPEWQLIPDERERKGLAADFIANIAAIHKADWRALGLDFLGDPGPGQGSARQQVERWEEVIAKAGFLKKPVVNYAAHWLRDNLPDNDHVVVVHGDYRTGNYVHQDGRIKAVLDWEMVHLGDPMDDVSYIIGTAWRSPRPHLWISHLMPREEFYERYQDATGIKIDKERLKFYHILINFKAVGIAGNAANAFRSKPTTDLKTGVFGITLYIQYHNLIRALSKYLDR